MQNPVFGAVTSLANEKPYIYPLGTPTGNYSGASKSVSATLYGAGEKQPNFTVITGEEIFHTCDLIVAKPANGASSDYPKNCWIKITYNSKSIVARVTDLCDRNTIDLSSGGVAKALGITGTATVTISAP